MKMKYMPACNNCLTKIENYLNEKLPDLHAGRPWEPFENLCQKLENDKCHHPFQGRVEAFKDMLRAAGNMIVHPLVHLIWIIDGIARLIVPPKRPDSDEFISRKEVASHILEYAVCVLTSCAGQAVLSVVGLLYPPIVYMTYLDRFKVVIHPDTYSEFRLQGAVNNKKETTHVEKYEKIKKEGQGLVDEILAKLSSLGSSEEDTKLKNEIQEKIRQSIQIFDHNGCKLSHGDLKRIHYPPILPTARSFPDISAG